MTGKQLRTALQIDAAMQALLRSGKDGMIVFAGMAEHMADFKWLIDTAEPGVMDELCQRFAGFFHYAQVVGIAAAEIQSGAIAVPKEASAGDPSCALPRQARCVHAIR